MNTIRTANRSITRKVSPVPKSSSVTVPAKPTVPPPKKKLANPKKGFTLIELLVVIGIIAVLAGVVLVAVNPARQFKMARDSQRVSNVNTILNAIGQNLAEHKGQFICAGNVMTIPATSTIIRSKISTDIGTTYAGDIYSCIIPDYISSLPVDPSNILAHDTDATDYDTEYSFSSDTNGRITVAAVPELATSISVTR